MAATISLNKRESTLISVYISGLDKNYTKNDRKIVWYINGSPDGQDSLDGGVTQSEVWDFTGLEPETSYTIKARIYNSDWSVDVTTEPREITTKAEEVTPEPDPDEPSGEELDYFYWRTKNKEYFESGDEVSLVTASKWKELVGLIENLINLTDEDSWYTKSSNTGKTYLSATKCKNVSSGSEIKAEIYDSVRFQLAARTIANMDDPGSVESKDTIYPEHFNSLQDAINNCIDKYNNSL